MTGLRTIRKNLFGQTVRIAEMQSKPAPPVPCTAL